MGCVDDGGTGGGKEGGDWEDDSPWVVGAGDAV